MRGMGTAVMVALLLAGWPAASARAQDAAWPLESRAAKIRATLARALVDIVYVASLEDQIQRLAVAQGTTTTATADSALARKVADLVASPPDAAEMKRTKARYLSAAEAYVAKLASELGPAADDEAVRSTLKQLQGELAGWLEHDLDPRPLVERVQAIAARARGKPEAAPFVGSEERIFRALPDQDLRAMLVAAEPGSGLDKLPLDAPPLAEVVVAGASPPSVSGDQVFAVDARPSGPEMQPITVLVATYGGNCGAKRGNATLALAEACDGRQECAYTLDLDALGGRIQGCASEFSTSWRCGEADETNTVTLLAEAGRSGTVRLACPPSDARGIARAPTTEKPQMPSDQALFAALIAAARQAIVGGSPVVVEIQPTEPYASNAVDLGISVTDGLPVVAVAAGSVAEAGGLLAGDIVVEAAGHAIRTVTDLDAALRSARADDAMVLMVRRRDSVVELHLPPLTEP